MLAALGRSPARSTSNAFRGVPPLDICHSGIELGVDGCPVIVTRQTVDRLFLTSVPGNTSATTRWLGAAAVTTTARPAIGTCSSSPARQQLQPPRARPPSPATAAASSITYAVGAMLITSQHYLVVALLIHLVAHRLSMTARTAVREHAADSRRTGYLPLVCFKFRLSAHHREKARGPRGRSVDLQTVIKYAVNQHTLPGSYGAGNTSVNAVVWASVTSCWTVLAARQYRVAAGVN